MATVTFHKAFELCDVVSVCLLSQETGQILLTGSSSPSGSVSLQKAAENLYRFPCTKVANDEWMKTGVDFAISLVGKAINVSLLKLFKIWVPFHAHKYIYHIVFLVKIQNDVNKKMRGNAFKVVIK